MKRTDENVYVVNREDLQTDCKSSIICDKKNAELITLGENFSTDDFGTERKHVVPYECDCYFVSTYTNSNLDAGYKIVHLHDGEEDIVMDENLQFSYDTDHAEKLLETAYLYKKRVFDLMKQFPVAIL